MSAKLENTNNGKLSWIANACLVSTFCPRSTDVWGLDAREGEKRPELEPEKSNTQALHSIIVRKSSQNRGQATGAIVCT